MRGSDSTGAVASGDVGMCKSTEADAGVCVCELIWPVGMMKQLRRVLCLCVSEDGLTRLHN